MPTPTLDIDYSDPIVGGKGIEQFTAAQVTTPALPSGTQTPVIPLQENQNEMLTGEGVTDASIPQSPVQQGDVYTVTDQQAATISTLDAPTYDATVGTAAQGTVTEESTVQGQLKNLMKDVEQGTAPWASGAIRYANNEMIKRGIGASSIAGASISTAIMEAAVPIAQLDAATFGAMNLHNLRNRQETMTSNVAAQNVAKQFNAKTTTEVDQFMSGMRDRLVRFNIEQKTSMSRFNAKETNAADQFYDTMSNEMDKFVSNNKMVIKRSNAEWRRIMNLSNTAAANAALHQDTQNSFNLSAQAMDNMWQRARDVFHWANQSSENQKERAQKVVNYALERSDFLSNRSHEERNEFFTGLGDLVTNMYSIYKR